MKKSSYLSIEEQLRGVCFEALSHLYALDVSEDAIQFSPTRSEFEGDYTLVVFPFLKASKKNPVDTANEIGEYLQEKHPEVIARYNVVKGFLNIVLSDACYLGFFDEISSHKHFGIETPGADAPLYMVEYSSPNTNKPLHLGHVRNILLGYSLSSILMASGKRVVKTNIVNDRGVHICKSMYAWQEWMNGATPESTGRKGDHFVGDCYVLFNTKLTEEINALMAERQLTKEQAEGESKIMRAVREMLQKWEAGDEAVLELWNKMNAWVYEGFDQTYNVLGVDFDDIYYESQTYLTGKEEVLRGLDEGVFVQDADNSVWVDLTNDGYDRKILLRADGTSVYITQDIGTAKKRYERYPIDQMIYVVGNEQEYHFQVLSVILDKLGYSFGKNLRHFSYGMVELPNGKLKSREGKVVDADTLVDLLTENALRVTEELGKLSDFSESEKAFTARMIGLGALKYFILKIDPRKNMLFNPDKPIEFNGDTGPFIQYTYARIQSVLRKATEQGVAPYERGKRGELDALEKTIIMRLNAFPMVIQTAAEELNPAMIASYCYELVRAFNQFYHDLSILNSEVAEERSFRVALSAKVADVLLDGMKLLGIDLPSRM